MRGASFLLWSSISFFIIGINASGTPVSSSSGKGEGEGEGEGPGTSSTFIGTSSRSSACVPNVLANQICRPSTRACEVRPWKNSDASNEATWRRNGGNVQYPTPLNPSDPLIHQQATGINLKINYCVLHPRVNGSEAYNDETPPGWESMTPATKRSRAHIWPKDISGSGRYHLNIVGFYHLPNKAMSTLECKLRTAYEDLGLSEEDEVYYTVYVIYGWNASEELPTRMLLYANVKFQYRNSSTNSVTHTYQPWFAGYANNKVDAGLVTMYDRSTAIKHLKQTVAGEPSGRTCPSASGSNPLWSLDFYPGMSLDMSPWNLDQRSDGPTVNPGSTGLYYTDTNQSGRNKWVFLRSTRRLRATNGAAIRFRMVLYETKSSEVKFTLGGGIILRFTNSGAVADWVYWDGSFKQLAASEIKAGSSWTDIFIVYKNDRTYLYEQGTLKFDVPRSNGNGVELTFHLQVLDENSDTKMLLSNVFVNEDLGI